MKRRLMSFVLAAVMVVTMLPVSHAADADSFVDVKVYTNLASPKDEMTITLLRHQGTHYAEISILAQLSNYTYKKSGSTITFSRGGNNIRIDTGLYTTNRKDYLPLVSTLTKLNTWCRLIDETLLTNWYYTPKELLAKTDSFMVNNTYRLDPLNDMGWFWGVYVSLAMAYNAAQDIGSLVAGTYESKMYKDVFVRVMQQTEADSDLLELVDSIHSIYGNVKIPEKIYKELFNDELFDDAENWTGGANDDGLIDLFGKAYKKYDAANKMIDISSLIDAVDFLLSASTVGEIYVKGIEVAYKDDTSTMGKAAKEVARYYRTGENDAVNDYVMDVLAGEISGTITEMVGGKLLSPALKVVDRVLESTCSASSKADAGIDLQILSGVQATSRSKYLKLKEAADTTEEIETALSLALLYLKSTYEMIESVEFDSKVKVSVSSKKTEIERLIKELTAYSGHVMQVQNKGVDSAVSNCSFSTVSSATDNLALSDATYPTALSVGQWFVLQGTVTSASSKITSVTAGVFNSSGKMVTGKTTAPNSKSYNIHDLDNDVLFDSLSAGTYSYIIRATNASGTKELLNKTFTVGSGSSSDTLSLSDETYPTSLSVGQWFALKGTVTSSVSNITSLTAGAFDSAGNMKTGNTVSPNAKSYNIVNIDPDVHFDWLPAGTYSYIIRATNASGTKELLNKSFTVGGGSSGSGSTISASGRYSVTNTRNITGQDIVATARQWANEGATYWSHYDPWLPSIYWRTGYTYSGQQSFDCSGFVSRVLNDCGLRSGNYTPPYGDCILSQQYGNGFMSIQIEDLVNYGTDITDAVKRARNGDYSGLQPGDLIAWTSGSLGRHIIIYAGMKNGTPWTVEFTGGGYRDRAMPAEYQSAFQFGARLVSDAGAACSEHTKGEFLFYEGAHPHYNYYACASCGAKFTDGSFTKLSDCFACTSACTNHVKGMYSHCETEHPHYIYYYCNNCEELFKSTSTTKLDTCESCTPKDTMTLTGGIFPTELIEGETFAIGGIVTSTNSSLKTVLIQVEDLKGNPYLQKAVKPNAKSYNLAMASSDYPFEFEALKEGNYNYIVYATNATSTEQLCSVKFTVNAKVMSDVRRGQWYYDAVQYVMENGIMSGYNATTFGTNDNLSRAMVVQVLYNKEGQPTISGKHKFPDVPSSQWYNNAVTWASQRSVVGGYGDGRFGPDDSVTLEQVAVILWNYSKNPAGTGSLSGIKGQYSDWAANALRWCAGKGILNNVPYSNATEKATRAQTAQILTNFLSMPETKTLSLVAGGPSGTWFNMGYILQSILNSELSQSQLAITPSSGSIDNIHKIENGEADLAFVSADIVKDAHNGKNSFSSGKETSALWVAGLYPEAVQIVATPDITDVSQLRGKVVCVGETGSSTYNIASRILAEYGLSMKDIKAVNGSFQDGIEGIKDGKVDAAITVAFAPTSAITELASAHDFSLVPLTGFGGDDLIPFTLPAGTYNGIDRKTDCVAVQSALVASEDVPEEVVYELLKAIFDNEPALKNAYNRFKSLDVDQAALNSVSMHPGAQKYYREIGVLK